MDHELLAHPIGSTIVPHSIVVAGHSIVVVEHSIAVVLHAIVVGVRVDSMLLVQYHVIKHYHKLENLDTTLDSRLLENEQAVRVVVRLMNWPQRR